MDLTSKEIRLFVTRKDLLHIFLWLATRDEKTKQKKKKKRNMISQYFAPKIISF